MEEGFELLERLEGLVSRRADLPPLPMFTSCCPGWIGFVETCAPEIIPHVSTCKSPHMMVGAVLKTYFAEVGAGGTKPCSCCGGCTAVGSPSYCRGGRLVPLASLGGALLG